MRTVVIMDLASRIRRARYDSGTCPLCLGDILIGQQIGLISQGWAHTSCVLFGSGDAPQERDGG
jgi:hypothetical protein